MCFQIHLKESESQKPKLSDSTMRDMSDIVLLATKIDLRDVSESPSTVLHYVLVCKDDVYGRTLHNIFLLCYLVCCRNSKMFFPMSYLWDFLHFMESNTAST